ncbi:hypothetical protein SteCoe_25309 [Stentor coeruleus]|uniref:Uncharacterized protein n=1 Tax=Stentor coeruleus TaxID=5963 RepID=A0A1R2BFN1_9CILI|nr:hypothetical protein SteCoe_25309 [Stentor coeruleus]
MSYASSNPILLKASDIHFKGIKNAKKFRKTFKSQFLNSSYLVSRDFQDRIPILPDIIIPDRKPIHGRAVLMKTRTLPMIKVNEPESEIKSQIYHYEPQSSDKIFMPLSNSVISMEKLIKTSVKKIKLQSLLPPEHKKSSVEEVRIEITNCDDTTYNSPTIINTMPNNYLFPQIRSPSSMHLQNSSSRITLSPVASRSSSVIDRKEQNEDPFFYANLLKNLNFSSFNCILEGLVEPHNNTFPYYVRVMKIISKVKPKEKKIIYKKPKCYNQCNCNTINYSEQNEKYQNPQRKIVKVPNLDDVKKYIPGLKCIKLDPQPVIYEDYIIVLNFEGVLGSHISEICIKPGTLKNIKKLGEFFRIVLILQTTDEKMMAIMSIFQGLGINLSGVYLRKDVYKNIQLSKLLDYSLIYEDFSIQDPERQVVIIASHRYMEDIESNPSVVISSKSGLSYKLNIERSPLPCDIYKNPPVTILMPNYQIKSTSDILKKLLIQMEFIGKFEYHKNLLNFRNMLISPNYIVVRSMVIHEILAEFFGVNRKRALKTMMQIKDSHSKYAAYCKLHDKHLVRYFDTFYENIFVIN